MHWTKAKFEAVTALSEILSRVSNLLGRLFSRGVRRSLVAEEMREIYQLLTRERQLRKVEVRWEKVSDVV